LKKLFTILIATLIVCSALTYAQQQYGRIYGTILDEEGMPLPGVTVTLESEKIPTRSSVTSEKGYFRFINLAPGKFKVTMELPGFVTQVRENVPVTIGGTVDFRITFTVATLEEEITVIASSPIVDTKKTGLVTNLKEEILANIPSARDPWVIISQVPGIMMDRENVGGSESGQQSSWTSRGGINDDDMWTVDGVTITDQSATGASPTYYDFDVFEEIQVTTGGADPSIQAGGVALNFVTKRGGNAFHGTAYFYRTGEKFGKFPMQATNVPADMAAKGYVGNRINQIKDFGFEVGGPVFKDRLWFWTAYGVQDVKMWAITGAADDTLLENLSFKVDFQVLENNRLTFFYMRGDKNKWGRNASIFRPPGTAWDQTGPSPIYKFADEHIFSENLLVTAQYAFVDGGFQLAPQGGSAQPVYDYATRVWGNSYYRYKTVRPQDQVNLDANLYIEDLLGAGHELKFGVEYRKTPTYSNWSPDAQVVGGYNNGVALDAWFLRGGIDNKSSTKYSAYIGDTITAGRLTLNLGLRYDWQKAYLFENNVAANPLIPNEMPGIAFGGLDAPFAWSDFSPRTGFTYDLSGDGKTLLRGTFNMYGGIMGNWLADYLNPLGTAEIDYYWNDGNGDGLVTVNELTGYPDSPSWWGGIDPANPTLASSNNTISADLSSPKTWEAIIGFEREILPDFSVTIQGVYRKYTNFWWNNYQEGEAPTWSATTSVVDPLSGDSFDIYTASVSNPIGRDRENRTDNYSRDYKGGDIILTKRLSDKWMMNASFTVNFTKVSWDNSLNPFDPTDYWATNGKYYAPMDTGSGKSDIWIGSRWQFKVSGMYQLPYGFNVSGFLDAREGYVIPYYTQGVQRSGGWGWNNPDVNSFGDLRLPTFWKLDLRIEKVFSMGDWGNLSFIADIFNVFNQNMSLGVDRLTSSANFGDSLEVLGPRVFRAGVRIRF
jgi:hypothetical protein